ncbi:MAG: hypothetical protein AVDCRST_MAG49-2471 [uncultured Thermomicrobiales bacterium]|uniref:CHRD domain-containing protein n=1 Tax=uncultured Thermomicrobiales bacterium TaxID=1645740 RepID=A0A6J4UYC8_9BACT|nr:MAG: hypothetical protein AVDCRST_MAG49-2471 [uncultured Thermomicrobiales bacterium]
MGQLRFVPTAIVAVALLLVAGFAAVGRPSAAQDTTGTPGAMMAHPAHIHSGTCDTLGEVVFPLNDLTAPGMSGTPVAGTPALDASPVVITDASPAAGMDATPMAGAGEVVATSTTIVQVSLDDILAAEHAINVHESAENIQNYIACGDITGTPANGELGIELNELNGSGFEGRALLLDNGDGTTTVTVELTMTDAGTTGTPDATPGA